MRRAEIWDVHGIAIAVCRKNVKRLTLAVSPTGVRISAPAQASAACIRQFVESHVEWIHRQQEAINNQAPGLQYADGEEHLLWGEPHVLAVHPHQRRYNVELARGVIHVSLKEAAEPELVEAILGEWRKILVRQAALIPLESLRQKMALPEVDLTVRIMRSRWGSCSPHKGKICLNAKLSQFPRLCLEGVIAHELTHFLVPNHSESFYTLMEKYFPQWRQVRGILKGGQNNRREA